MNIELAITGISPANRRVKMLKAIRAISKKLGVPVSVEQKSKAHGQESYFYDIQQELADRWIFFYSPILKNVYETISAVMGLPRIEVETMRKAINGDDPLRYIGFGPIGKLLHKLGFYKGKVVYNPETGTPLKQKDFDELIEAIQNF
jgi:hypothetical protein